MKYLASLAFLSYSVSAGGFNCTQDAQGVTSCDSCETGYSGSDCQTRQCTPGWFSGDGNQPCQRCSRGSFGSGYGATSCTPCAAGSFNDQEGHTACRPCVAGRFSSATGAERCEFCPIGTFNANSGASECQDCPEGSFNAYPGRTFCTTVESVKFCLLCKTSVFFDQI